MFTKEQKQINNFSFTPKDKAEYKKKGISHIEKMFPVSTIKKLKESAEANFKPEDNPEGVITEFDRFSYDFSGENRMKQWEHYQLADRHYGEKCG